MPYRGQRVCALQGTNSKYGVLVDRDDNKTKKGYVAIPVSWLDIDGFLPQDMYRLMLLWWQYDKFVNLSRIGGRVDYLKSFYLSQEGMCELLKFSKSSRSKVSTFLQKLEDMGFIHRIKSVFYNGKETMPRHYIIVLNPESIYYEQQKKSLEVYLNGKAT